jgi:hypothetical protein
MDITEPFTPIKAEHKYILNVRDLFTMFLVIIPTETTVIHVADEFIRNFISILGPSLIWLKVHCSQL